tara:strand:+ start:280 stop:561 length:282 start_codon:yes stop_codon:yes gene_type:complete
MATFTSHLTVAAGIERINKKFEEANLETRFEDFHLQQWKDIYQNLGDGPWSSRTVRINYVDVKIPIEMLESAIGHLGPRPSHSLEQLRNRHGN